MAHSKLILDLDGVFGDFAQGACVVHGRPDFVVDKWNFFKDWGITAEEFWKPIRDLGNVFYNEIVQPYPWAQELLRSCLEYDPLCVFASIAGGGHPADYSGKVLFVQKHFGSFPVIVMPGGGVDSGLKALMSRKGRVLLDDSDDNIVDWWRSGGDAITFPQPWNTTRSFATHRIEYVRGQLERLMT